MERYDKFTILKIVVFFIYLNLKIFYIAIPYAEPPVRELRFKKPVPVRSWNDTRNGTVFSSRCVQKSMGPGSPVSEDCLYLNIFIRAESFLEYQFGSGQKKPIYVFIHGGRFILGSGSDSSLDPSINVALTDVIYVTINYRYSEILIIFIFSFIDFVIRNKTYKTWPIWIHAFS
jgi:carboxylesterase type B